MNKFIKKELQKCKVAPIPYWDDNTTELHIPLYNNDCVKVAFLRNHYYVIQVSPSVYSPAPDDSFSLNWNRGRVPSPRMLITVCNEMGEYIQVDGCSWENDHAGSAVYNGLWLPKKAIQLIKELT